MTNARASQLVGEAATIGSPSAHSSQIVGEPLVIGSPKVRSTQLVAEVLLVGTHEGRVSQLALEVLFCIIGADVLPVFPTLPGLGYNVKWTPTFFNMATETTASGADIDLALAATPLHSFELTYDFLRDGVLNNKSSSEFKTMFGFFLRLGGTVGRFLFQNPDDYQVKGQAVATTDGATNTWTLQRTFGVGQNSGTEAVGVVDTTQTINVYFDGVLQDPSTYQILTTSPCVQQLKITATPAAGKAVTIDMSYFYYCKFDANTLTFEKFLDRVWLLNSVTFHSCRPGA